MNDEARQLHLFRPKGRGTIVRPRAKEFDLHCMVADTLRLNCHPFWRYTHLPMGEKRDPVTAMRLKRMGVMPGWPDFMFLHWRTGNMVWLELKRPGIKAEPSTAQEAMAQFIRDCDGHKYFCTNDYRMAIDLLRDHGIVRARVSA